MRHVAQSLLGCCLLVAGEGCAAGEMVVAPGVTVEKVFGPEEPGDYKHPAAITELTNGDLYLAYYCGSGEYGEDTAVYGARLKKGATAWTKPKVIADTPWLSEGNPVVWQGPDGLVWLFYVNRYGETWSNSRIKAKISKDGAETWSDSFMLAMEEGMMVRGKPIVLAGGDYLLPIYHETGHDRENVGDDTTGLFLRYDVKKKKWTETNRITARLGCLQPAVAQITDKYLVAYCRRGGGYFPRSDGWMIRSESRDGGRTWSKGVETKFPNPNAAVDLVRLQNGHLMLVYNDSMRKRAPLTVAISTDNDQSYPIKKNIVEGPGPYAYPYAIQARDGKIHVIFTSNNRTTVYHAVFEESAILEGADR